MILLFKILFKNTYLFFTNAYYREFLRLSLFYGDSERKKSKQIKFLSYKFIVSDALSFIWQFKELFVDEYYHFRSDKKVPIIYDCGSNVGTSCIYFKRLYPQARIKAFEADPALAQILKSNMAANKIHDVEVNAAAVWINSMGIEMTMEGADAASIYSSGKKTKVNSMRLKELLMQEAEIDFLKLDVEGAETEIIKDCKNNLRHIRNIFIEYHSFIGFEQELNKILDILTLNKFRFYIISSTLLRRPFTSNSVNEYGMDLQLNIFAKNTSFIENTPL